MSASDTWEVGDAVLTLGPKRVGPGEPTFVIAEAGVNHGGCVETALTMVDAAAEAGVDAVKFQMFRAADLATASAATAAYQSDACGEASQGEMLATLELPAEAFVEIKARCESREIVFLATPFGQNEVTRLVEIGAPALKIASTDLTNTPLLVEAASTGLPIVLSTGASTEAEIAAAVAVLERSGAGGRFALLHCVSCYPTPLARANLGAIASLRRRFRAPCGFSDHTTSIQTGGWAVAAGACILEKHFTLDPSADGPDQALSLDPGQLSDYVSGVRDVERAMGDGRLGFRAWEVEVRRVATRSVVAAVDIAAGTALTEGLLALKRPGTGIAPSQLPGLVDRRAAVDIPYDTVLSWDMLQ